MARPRLDRFIAHALQCSRADAQRLVRRGRIWVAGELAKDPSEHVPEGAEVKVDDRVIAMPGQIVLMLHKPPGVVSATRDSNDRTVLDVVPADMRNRDLSPVGRLDKDATGLLLLTNDGDLLHRLTHPRRHVPRTYELTWSGELPADAVARVAAGMKLDDGTECMPAELVITGADTGTMTVHQGMYHQVKRMIAALGGVVTRLHRPRYGALALGDLPLGATRALDRAELELIGAFPDPAKV